MLHGCLFYQRPVALTQSLGPWMEEDGSLVALALALSAGVRIMDGRL